MRCRATATDRGEPRLYDEIDRADVDAQFERCGGDHRSQLAVLQAVFRLEALFFRKAAVMRHHDPFAETFRKREGNAFAHPAGADENKRGAMRANVVGNAIVNFRPHLSTRDGTEFVAGHLHRQIHVAFGSDIDDVRVGT